MSAQPSSRQCASIPLSSATLLPPHLLLDLTNQHRAPSWHRLMDPTAAAVPSLPTPTGTRLTQAAAWLEHAHGSSRGVGGLSCAHAQPRRCCGPICTGLSPTRRMAEGAGRAWRMRASASSALRRRGRHLLLGLASPLLPCSRWPPPPSPATRRVLLIRCKCL
jgi:hypothetical protein